MGLPHSDNFRLICSNMQILTQGDGLTELYLDLGVCILECWMSNPEHQNMLGKCSTTELHHQ
jgi:hypothetical protein